MLTALLLFLLGVLIGIVGGLVWLHALDRPLPRKWEADAEWLATMRGEDS